MGNNGHNVFPMIKILQQVATGMFGTGKVWQIVVRQTQILAYNWYPYGQNPSTCQTFFTNCLAIRKNSRYMVLLYIYTVTSTACLNAMKCGVCMCYVLAVFILYRTYSTTANLGQIL